MSQHGDLNDKHNPWLFAVAIFHSAIFWLIFGSPFLFIFSMILVVKQQKMTAQ